MEKNEILVIYGKKYKEMAKILLHEAKLADLIPSKETRIGIKPNQVSQALPEDGATTHPEVVSGLIEYLKEHGFGNIVMLEGSWVGDTTQEAVRSCGYDKVSEEYDIPFWDMQKDEAMDRDCAGMKLKLCKSVDNIQFLINVPVLKGHCQTRMTCALKNMKGLLPNSEKRRFHRMGLHDPIAHLATGIHQDFILVDSICGDLTFEDGGNPVQQDRLIAARDPVLCDVYGCSLIGVPVNKVPYITKAASLGAGCGDLKKAKVTVLDTRKQNAKDRNENSGSSGEAKQDRTWTQQESSEMGEAALNSGFGKVLKLAEKAEEIDSCSACYGYLIPALSKLQEEGLLDQLDEKICIGQGHRGTEGELGVGNCTRQFRHTLKGCPPTEIEMYEFLKEYIKNLKKK